MKTLVQTDKERENTKEIPKLRAEEARGLERQWWQQLWLWLWLWPWLWLRTGSLPSIGDQPVHVFPMCRASPDHSLLLCFQTS